MKIKLVTGLDFKNHELLLGEMFAARKRLFADRLGWDVNVDENGWEMDQYDPLHPLYLIAIRLYCSEFARQAYRLEFNRLSGFLTAE